MLAWFNRVIMSSCLSFDKGGEGRKKGLLENCESDARVFFYHDPDRG